MANSQTLFFAMITLLAGIGIPTMAAMNAHLGTRMASPIAATVVLFMVGGTISLFLLLASGTLPKQILSVAPPVYYFAGLLMAFYAISITWIAPQFGVGNAVFFVLFGQLIAAATIDHFGLFGAPIAPIDLKRSVGLVFMATGVFLSRNQL